MGQQETCAKGCVEPFSSLYAKDGIIRYTWEGRNKFQTRLSAYYDDPRFKRFSGWGYKQPLQEWFDSLVKSYWESRT